MRTMQFSSDLLVFWAKRYFKLGTSTSRAHAARLPTGSVMHKDQRQELLSASWRVLQPETR